MVSAQARIDCDFEWKRFRDERRGQGGADRNGGALLYSLINNDGIDMDFSCHLIKMPWHHITVTSHTIRATNRVAIVCVALAYDSSAWHLYHAIC